MRIRMTCAATLLAYAAVANGANYDGELDPNFAAYGVVDFTLHNFLQPVAVLHQADGKLVVVGASVDGNNQRNSFALRLNPDGSRDAGFGGTDGPGLQTYGTGGTSTTAAALRPSGGILIAGSPGYVAALTPRGDGDYSFFTGDYVIHAAKANVEFNAVVALPDNSFLAAGSRIQDFRADKDFYIAHYNANGALLNDVTYYFDIGGTYDDVVYGMAVAGKRVVLVGAVSTSTVISTTSGSSFERDCGIVALDLDTLGLDPAWNTFVFGWDGNFYPNSDDLCRSVAIQADAKVVVGGEAYAAISELGTSYLASYWAVARFDPSGAPDGTFGDSTTSQRVGAYKESGPGVFNGIGAGALAVQNDGKIVFSGYASNTSLDYAPADFGIGRLSASGDRDSSFGDDSGTVRIGDVFNEGQGGVASSQYATGLTLDGERPVVVGLNLEYPDSSNVIDTMVVRLQNDHLFGSGFGPSGQDDLTPVR
jgi:uncharacterized delta-60 repeat protein